MICLPDEFTLQFRQVVNDCCFQWPNSVDIPLERVYRSQAYWNSDRCLAYYGASTDTWFYQQFHLHCVRIVGVQTFTLRWLFGVDVRQCEPDPTPGPPFEGLTWIFQYQECKPFELKFTVEDVASVACYEDGLSDPDDPIVYCDFEAIITEVP